MPLLIPMASHNQKSHVAPQFNYPNLRNAMVPLVMLLKLCDYDASANSIKWPKCQVTLHFYCLYLWNATVPLASCSVNTSANGITWKRSHVAPHFDCFDLVNEMVVFTMPVASCDVKQQCQWHHMTKKLMLHLILIILIIQMQLCHWQYHQHNMIQMPAPNASHNQKVMLLLFCEHLDLNNGNGAIDHTVGIMWHWQQHQWHHMTKKLCCTIFQLYWPNEYNGAIHNATGITWCWCQCQQCQMIEKVMSLLILIIFN